MQLMLNHVRRHRTRGSDWYWSCWCVGRAWMFVHQFQWYRQCKDINQHIVLKYQTMEYAQQRVQYLLQSFNSLYSSFWLHRNFSSTTCVTCIMLSNHLALWGKQPLIFLRTLYHSPMFWMRSSLIYSFRATKCMNLFNPSHWWTQ